MDVPRNGHPAQGQFQTGNGGQASGVVGGWEFGVFGRVVVFVPTFVQAKSVIEVEVFEQDFLVLFAQQDDGVEAAALGLENTFDRVFIENGLLDGQPQGFSGGKPNADSGAVALGMKGRFKKGKKTDDKQ